MVPDHYKLRLRLPVLSGASYVFRDGIPSSATGYATGKAGQFDFIGLTFGREWSSGFIAEGNLGWVLTDRAYPRETLGLRAGRAWLFGDSRNPRGRGTVTSWQGLAGLAYRGQAYDWIHTRSYQGQSSLAVTATGALDVTYYTSPRFGWNLRLRTEAALVVVRSGPTVWSDGEGTIVDGYRAALGGGIDLGVAF